MTNKPTYSELEQRVKALQENVRECKEAVDELRKYQYMVESAHDAIFFKDIKSRYIIANHKTLEAFGLSRDNVFGKNDYELMSDQNEANNNVSDDQLVFKSGKPTEVVKHMTGADGKEYWFQAKKVPQFDSDGQVIGLVGIARDITDRKKAVKALKQSEKKYHTFIDSTSDFVFLKDEQFRHVIVNKAYGDYLGKQKEEIIGKTDFDLLPPLLAEGCRRSDLSALKANGVIVNEEREGNRIYETRKFPVSLGDGKLGIGGFVREITEQKQVKEALRESEEKYRNFIDNAPVAMYTLNTKGEFTYGNKKVLDVTGYNTEDWLNKPFYPVIHPDDLEHLSERVRDRLAGKEPKNPYEVRIIDSSGKTMWVKLTAQAIYDTDETGAKKIIGIQSFFEDITDQKLAEQALKESEEKYRNLVERANDGVIIVQDGSIQYSNSRLAGIFGFIVEEMVNTPFLDYVFPDERARIADLHGRRLKGEDVPRVFEMVGLHKDGRRLDLEINSGLITYQGKLATFSFVRDITDRKRAETIRLQKERLQGIVELAGAVCHELNQPLQAIGGISDLLMMDLPDDSQTGQYIQIVKRRVEEMAEITRRLMLVTKYQTKDYLKGKIVDIEKASD